MGWEFLTKVINLPEDRLYVTYFGGDEKLGLSADLEAKQMWLDLGVEEKRLIPGNVKDNFWGECVVYIFKRAGSLIFFFFFLDRNGRNWSLWSLFRNPL